MIASILNTDKLRDEVQVNSVTVDDGLCIGVTLSTERQGMISVMLDADTWQAVVDAITPTLLRHTASKMEAADVE